MPPYLCGEVADSKGGVFPETSGERVNPGCRFTRGLPVRPFQKPLQRGAQTIFGCFSFAGLDEPAGLHPGATSDAQHDRHGRNQPASKPGRIEFDLDFGLVQIRPDHKERKNGPIMGVLWHAGVAPIDDPSDRGSAEASQHEIPSRLRTL